MYRHLLVPIDDSDLAVELVGNAVGLAREVKARITFFHAVPDHAASLSGDAEILRATSREDFDYAYAGKARELLAKAEAAARAFEVPCDSLHVVNDKPSAAIIEAARARACDLIVMASHGRRGRLGMALASETLAVLMNAGFPVLVAATADPKPPAHAIGIIRDEHRSLAAVLHAWMHLLRTARERDNAVDPAVLRAIVRYIHDFPVALHHPKEEDHLFRRLRERTSTLHAELDELERQHDRDHRLVDQLAQLVEAIERAGDDATRQRATLALEEAVASYASFMWEHVGREEGVILPAAQRYLTEADWAEIDAAFSENRDPRFGSDTQREYRHLFSRIVNLAEQT